MKINDDGSLINETHIARVTPGDESCATVKVPQTETKCALLANLYLSEGQKGKVSTFRTQTVVHKFPSIDYDESSKFFPYISIGSQVVRVHCRKRIGSDNFIAACRNVVREAFGDKQVGKLNSFCKINTKDSPKWHDFIGSNICSGIGGVFILKNGSAHQHVMRDFSKTALHTEEDLNNWLKFYNMPGELVALGTFVTDEFDLDLRLQHFHSFSQSNWGGHYHYDTTPETIEYEAYFNVGERVVRIDRPTDTHKLGRD